MSEKIVFTFNGSFKLAPMSLRFYAGLIDVAVSFLVFAIPYGFFLAIGYLFELSVPNTQLDLPFLGTIVLGLLYHLLKDGLPGGQSVGKAFLGLRVVNEASGRACNFFESYNRNAYRLALSIDETMVVVVEK